MKCVFHCCTGFSSGETSSQVGSGHHQISKRSKRKSQEEPIDEVLKALKQDSEGKTS